MRRRYDRVYDRATAHAAGAGGDGDAAGQKVHRISLHNIGVDQQLHGSSAAPL